MRACPSGPRLKESGQRDRPTTAAAPDPCRPSSGEVPSAFRACQCQIPFTGCCPPCMLPLLAFTPACLLLQCLRLLSSFKLSCPPSLDSFHSLRTDLSHSGGTVTHPALHISTERSSLNYKSNPVSLLPHCLQHKLLSLLHSMQDETLPIPTLEMLVPKP